MTNEQLKRSAKDQAAREALYKDWKRMEKHYNVVGLTVNNDIIDRAMEIYGQAQWNAAIEKAAESAKIEKTGNSGSYLDASINKQSILKLKKP